jgi:hypothetical protein
MKTSLTFFLLIGLQAQLVFGDTIDSTFSNDPSLTDEQQRQANSFIHEGQKEKRYQEGCAKLNNCQVEEDKFPLEMLIGKAYALMGMMTSSGGFLPTLTKKPAANATSVEKPETQPDYCMMVAMAYETLGGFIQQGLQKKAEDQATGAGDVQLQALVSLKETHKARKKTAMFQSAIYGGVTACYGGLALTGSLQLDWKYWAKLGGATTLTALYVRKAAKHANAADQVQKVIDSLPKAGECNPWTKTSCFCSEPTSKARYPGEYQEVCVLNQGNFATPKVAVGCGSVVNNKLSFDQECECKKTNTCLKSDLKVNGATFSLATNYLNQANKGFNMLSEGILDEKKIDAYNLESGAMAKKLKGSLDPKSVPKVGLTAEEKKMADELKKFMPEALANVAAHSQPTYPSGGIKDSPMPSSAISKLPDSLKEKLAEAIDVNYKQGGGNTQSVSESPSFQMPKFGAQPAETHEGTEIVSFAEKAISKADVSNTPDTPIFDIISNRYRRSGWDKLGETEKK